MCIYLKSIFVNERQKFEGHCNMQISFFLQFSKILNVTSSTVKAKSEKSIESQRKEWIKKWIKNCFLNQSMFLQDRNLVDLSVILNA